MRKLGALLVSGRVVVIVATAAMVLSGVAWGQVKPGDFIGPDNASKVKDLVSPGVYTRIQHGMSFRIAPTERIDWPPPYKDATEKYAAQVRLDSDHSSILGYVAGQPFPLLDPNDPDVATKIMWNYYFRPISTDDFDLRFFDCESVYWGRNHSYRIIEFFLLGHYAGYNEMGRTEVEPLPVDPDFKQTGRLGMSALYPVLAPQDIAGEGLLRYRYWAPKRGDDNYLWNPGANRIRRLNDTLLSDNTGAQSYNPDDYECFSGKTTNYNWKFLGERNMLACIDDQQEPPPTCKTDGGASHCPTNWQMRHLYVIEGKAKPDRLKGDLYSRHVIYIDSEADFGMYQDQYDQQGQLFINYTSWMKFADRPVPDAKIAIYPFKREFQTGSSSVNVQTGLATVCYHPGYDVPEKECWYINMGAVDKQFFTVEAMTKAAP